MNRKTFLKTLGAILLAPKALANIKPRIPFLHKEYSAGFIITKEMIEDDLYNDIFKLGKLEIYSGKVDSPDRKLLAVINKPNA